MRAYTSRLVAAIFVSVLWAGCAGAQTVSERASRWIINPKVTGERLPYQTTNGIAADFPRVGDGWMGYIVTQPNGPLNGEALTMTLSIQTQQAKADKRVRFIPKPNDDGCVSPATLRFYFQSFDLYNSTPGTRWWSSTVFYELKEGIVTLTVPLDPRFFTGTFGEQATSMPAEFKYAMQHPTWVGLTIGGNCAYGHGAAVRKGAARLVIHDFQVR